MGSYGLERQLTYGNSQYSSCIYSGNDILKQVDEMYPSSYRSVYPEVQQCDLIAIILIREIMWRKGIYDIYPGYYFEDSTTLLQ